MEGLFGSFMFSIPTYDGESDLLTQEEGDKLLQGLVEVVGPEAKDAWELKNYTLPPIVLVPVAGEPSRHSIVDGRQGILSMCLMLAAARSRLLEASARLERELGGIDISYLEPAMVIERLVLQGGTNHEPPLDQPRVQLASQADTACLNHMLANPRSIPASEGPRSVSQQKLWLCLQRFCTWLDELPDARLVPLVHSILTNVTATEEKQTQQPEPRSQPVTEEAAAASQPSASPRKCLDHLPDSSEQLAASADTYLTLDGCQLPIHTAVLASGCRSLRQALSTAGTAEAKAAAVQEAFQGHALPDVQLFLRLLYSGGVAAEGVAEPEPFKQAVPMARTLDAPFACEARLLKLLGCNKFWWAEWLVLADRYGLRKLKPVAAERALSDLLSLSDSAERKALLHKMRGLSAGTYQVLFEAMVEGLVEAGSLKEK
ncbi:hypothetical protein ABPG77_001024 [Micractinium sp. CCAP 211/92]